MTTTTTSFALRIDPDLKAAAKALTQPWVSFDIPMPEREEHAARPVYLRSINEAFQFLIETGLGPTLGHIDAAVAQCRGEHDALSEVAKFFMDNPAATEARPTDLSDGSRGRDYLAHQIAVAIEEEGEDNAWASLPRDHVFAEYTDIQRRLMALTAAKGAIQKALTNKH